MAEKITVNGKGEDPFEFCKELEKGNILFFPEIPFSFPQEEIQFLLAQRQSGSKARKNIAYKPAIDKVTNHREATPEEAVEMHSILRNYSNRVTDFLSTFLEPYATKWKLDYASFRPYQEKGRNLRLRARNDLLHVDSFPTRPMNGGRILRFFTNINPEEARHWITSDSFKDLVQKFGGPKGVAFPKGEKNTLKTRLARKMKEGLKKLGFKVIMRSPYDRFMLGMHHHMKENAAFQENTHKDHWEFPPNSCWMVFTDQVSHAALSGQYALEQTFFIPRNALLHPEEAPVSILERLTGESMVIS